MHYPACFWRHWKHGVHPATPRPKTIDRLYRGSPSQHMWNGTFPLNAIYLLFNNCSTTKTQHHSIHTHQNMEGTINALSIQPSQVAQSRTISTTLQHKKGARCIFEIALQPSSFRAGEIMVEQIVQYTKLRWNLLAKTSRLVFCSPDNILIKTKTLYICSDCSACHLTFAALQWYRQTSSYSHPYFPTWYNLRLSHQTNK